MSAGADTDLLTSPAHRSESLRQTAAQIQRALDDLGNGSAFNHRRDTTTGALDPIPLTIDATEWARVGRALEQRAMVLELVLDDLFGPQRLLAGGHLPTQAVLTHREYLRQCVGIASPGAHRLVLYASDIARSTDGTFTVLADRTQMPSGIGSAVQNREVMARVNPEALHESDVQPIEDWLATCRAALGALAPPDIEQPRIVMMTPGSSSRDHSEHAYLARTLGFTLVEPTDLTVRDACVWLKSVAGLEPVHVIMRLVRSPDCDPLELGSESVLGVAGLVEACRRDNVAVANPLGSGVGECAALLPFMPRLTRTLLGEDPLIDSAPTWWCGERDGLSHVLANIDSLLIRCHDQVNGRHTRFGRLMTTAEREELARQITAQPHLYVGQQEVEIADQPSFSGTAIVERPTISRAFLVRDRGGYRCMEGGLTLTDDRAEAITFAAYGTSKDTWVTNAAAAPADGQVSRATVSTLVSASPLAPIDLRSSITSRAAESMFWIGRNLERSHAVIRLVRAVGLMNETRHDLKVDNDWTWTTTVDRLVNTVAGLGWLPTPAPPAQTTAELLTDALVDRSRARSLATSLHFLLQNAESVRELFSADSWRLLGQISDHHVKLSCAEPDHAAELALSSVTPLLALSGLIGDSMVRDPGWRFLDIGRRIEASSLVVMTLGTALVNDPSPDLAAPFLEAVLNTWDGLGAYRRRYRSDIDPALLVDLLVTDDSNPRSVVSQLTALVADLEELPGSEHRRVEVIETVRTLAALVASAEPAALATVDGTGRRPALALLTESVGSTLDAVATQIDLNDFVHVRPTNLFAGLLTNEAVVADSIDPAAPAGTSDQELPTT
ncbi:MAG: circularly permuted type 2 ATP-grasp protein [Acidimicrobiales bacterium]